MLATDFAASMLTNTLVFITYLNRDWRPEYGGALELWDGKRNQKVTEVAPVFGRIHWVRITI